VPIKWTVTMIELKQKYDASTLTVMRQALDEVVTDRRFLVRKSVTPLEMAEPYPSAGGIWRTRPQPSEKLRIRKAECRCLKRAATHRRTAPAQNARGWRSATRAARQMQPGRGLVTGSGKSARPLVHQARPEPMGKFPARAPVSQDANKKPAVCPSSTGGSRLPIHD
jgi:hypothetical protein